MPDSTVPLHPWVAAGADDVRFGITIAALEDHGAMRDEARYLEESGLDAVFLPDHPAMMGDPWITLAGIAEVTTRLRLGVLVSCAAYRHPMMLARSAADVDRISGGRALLGLGSGDMPHEFGMLGLDYGSAQARRERLEQALRVIPSLLRGEPVTDAGRDCSLQGAVLPMGPVQQPHVPIVLAGGSRATLRLAAQYADAVNIGPVAWAGGAYSSDDVAARFARLEELCGESGRTADSVLRTGIVGLSIGRTTEEAQGWLAGIPEEMRGFFAGLFFAGTVDDVARYLEKMISSGYRYLIFLPIDLFAGSRAMTDVMVREIIPRLRSA